MLRSSIHSNSKGMLEGGGGGGVGAVIFAVAFAIGGALDICQFSKSKNVITAAYPSVGLSHLWILKRPFTED